MSSSNSIKIPTALRKLVNVPFGFVDGESRGVNLMNPPIFLEDNYHWLRNDSRDDPKVLSYLEEENNYTKKIMTKHKLHENNMFEEIKSHVNENYESYPYPQGDGGWKSVYRYYTRTVEGKSYPIYCRKDMINDKEEMLLDVNVLAEGKTNYDVSSFSVTDNHKIMTYGVDENGSEKYRLIVKDINSKEELEHNIPNLMYCSYFWHNNYVYYEMGDDTNRMFQVWRYNFLTKENELIYQNDDELTSVGISMSNDKKYFFVSVSSYDSGEMYYFTEDNPELKLITKRIEKVLYSVTHHEGKLIIVTNMDDCINFKIMYTELENPGVENWREFIPYDESMYIKGVDEYKNHLLIIYRQNGTNKIRVIKLEDGCYNFNSMYDVSLDNEGQEQLDFLRNYLNKGEDPNVLEIENKIKELEEDMIRSVDLNSLDIYDTNIIWFSHDYLDTPVTLYEFNLDTKERKVLREKKIPNFDKDQYESKRIYAKSHDGVQVPMSIVYKKNLFHKNGSNPLYLYGYGSYGHTVDPDFSAKILPLLNRGFVYVIAHVRGGSFLGYKWYEAGKMKTKMNTFKDFIACAEHLISEKYTFEKGITIEGRSAGGLLVGACMTLRPDLFRTVIGGVPFVDVLNTMSDPSIPLTTPEWEQWGNPNQKEYFDYMKQYSPYDNIKETEYPNGLMLAGLNDPRVAYWEPAKFVAKLRHHKTDENLLLLKTEMEEGHFCGSDRYKYIRELAFSYTFVLKTYGMLVDYKYDIEYSK